MALSWQWFGRPGHFIAAHMCRHHLHTHVGDYCISTVGEYHPPDVMNKNPHKRRDPTEEPQEIGANRLYETMVFAILPSGDLDMSELDVDVYNDSKEADDGHLKMCHKWADKVSK